MASLHSDSRPLRSISATDARLAALRAQGFLAPVSARKRATVPSMLREVGAVQLDTISVLARSHELVACARLGAVPRDRIESAYWGTPARAFEYYAHAACVLPIEAWPYFAFRRRASQRRAWPVRESSVVREVRAHLSEGPLTTGDVGGARTGPSGWWNWSEAKQALEMLYHNGEAICTTRDRWKRVYDLPERAVPPALLAHEPTDAECYDYLVERAGRAMGVGTRRDIAGYFLLAAKYAGVPLDARALLDDAIARSSLIPVRVEGWAEPAFAHAAALAANHGERHHTTLLSPFDSLIWDRSRTERIFDFALSLEAYKPKEQRVHGYFSMPVLAGGQFVGRVDPAREGSTLVARHVILHDPAGANATAAAIREAATWVRCDDIRIERVTPPAARKPLLSAMA